MEDTKTCSKCKEEKDVERFSLKWCKTAAGKTQRRRSECKRCENKRKAPARDRNRRLHPEKSRARVRAWKNKNPDVIKLQKERRRPRERALYEANKDLRAHQARQWYAENKDRMREFSRKYYHEVIKKTPRLLLSKRSKSAIRKSIRGHNSPQGWRSALHFTPDQLRAHLEKQLLPGMSWENYGTVWHIDHIIPVAAFNITSVDDFDFRRCWCLSNLRPLWKADNLRKGRKLPFVVQAALPLVISPPKQTAMA